jgi:thiamine pyrophosphokinase
LLGIAVIGGEGPEPEALREIACHAGLLVAADSGLIVAEAAGLKPDWVLGDMDSLACQASGDGIARLDKYPPERVLRYPAGKDFTDTELAIALLREKGCDEIWLAGGGGGRTDHLFAIFSLFGRENPPDRWFTKSEEIRCLKEGRALGAALQGESRVSVFPLGAGPWEAESSGLEWPLDGLAWESSGLGLSNVAEEGPFEIRSVRGLFLVMWDCWSFSV